MWGCDDVMMSVERWIFCDVVVAARQVCKTGWTALKLKMREPGVIFSMCYMEF